MQKYEKYKPQNKVSVYGSCYLIMSSQHNVTVSIEGKAQINRMCLLHSGTKNFVQKIIKQHCKSVSD
jgi:hypothetical protein